MNTRPRNRKPFRVKEPTSVIHPQTISAGSFKKTISSADQVIPGCEMHKRNVVMKFCAMVLNTRGMLTGIFQGLPITFIFGEPPLPGLQHNCMYEKNTSARLGTTWLPLNNSSVLNPGGTSMLGCQGEAWRKNFPLKLAFEPQILPS